MVGVPVVFEVKQLTKTYLFRRGDEWAVFAVNDDRARLRPIVLGHRNNTFGEIVKGLQPGETVVLHPPDTLSDGARVARRDER